MNEKGLFLVLFSFLRQQRGGEGVVFAAVFADSSKLTGERMKSKRVNIILNRDSWCAADDMTDHREIVSVPADMSIKDFVWEVCRDYLRDVWRGEWLVYSGGEHPDDLGELLFSIKTAHPCTVNVISDWADGDGIPEKIYFKLVFSWEVKKYTIAESKDSFTLYKERLLSKLFKIRNQ